MNLNTQKEDFSYAYVYAVTAAAGYSLQAATRRLDDSGIDATITVPGKLKSKRLPRFDVQIKSTSQDVLREESIKYRLNVKNYEELSYDDPYVPQILIVVIVPSDTNEWLLQSEESLCLKCCGYWLSLRGQRVETYLKEHGWELHQKNGEKALILTLADEFEILLPLQPEIIDFPRRMGEVLETLALSEKRSQIEILSELITNYPNITIQGIVMQIANPNADKLSGEMTLLGVVVDKLRPIHTELTNHDYILAIKAYQERLPVTCKGDLIKEDNTYVLNNPYSFSIDKDGKFN